MDLKGQRGLEKEENKKGGGFCVLVFVEDGTCGFRIKPKVHCLYCGFQFQSEGFLVRKCTFICECVPEFNLCSWECCKNSNAPMHTLINP